MEIDPGAEDDAVLAPARSEARALPTEDKDLGPLAYAGGHGTARVVLIRFPAGVRSALGQTVEARAWSATSDPCRKKIAQRVPGPGHRNGLRGLTASWPNRAPADRASTRSKYARAQDDRVAGLQWVRPAGSPLVPVLVDITTASPPYCVGQTEARDFAREMFGRGHAHIERLLPIFDNSGIRTRYFCRPPEWYGIDHDPQERNAAFIESATDLCDRAARELLDRQGLAPADVDRVFFVNTTGLATPSIDARLINVLGLRRDVRRTPIWGLGCAGGAAGLSHAVHDLIGHPRQRALVFAAEMCSLTFLRDDLSKSNLVATALFADGAAVALVSGDEVDDTGYRVVGTRSTLYPDSLRVMGWNVVSRGLQVVFDQRIPAIVAAHAAGELDAFLAEHHLARADVAEYLYHPGGPKVLAAYAAAYGIDPSAFRWSRDVIARFGNMSSVTVLYVLADYRAVHPPGRSGYGVVSALGPGFSSETLLLQL